MYDLYMQRPRPIAPRHLRFEVDERVLVDGSVRRPVDQAEVRRLADRLRAEGIEAVGVCLLHAYANPAHEHLVGAILREALPDARGHPLERAGAGDPGVRAHVDDARQRVRPAPGPALSRAAAGAAARRRRRRRPLHHAVERRALRGGDGRPVPGPADRVGPGRRGARRRALRRAPRPQGPPVVRHGRHDGQGLRDLGRRAARLPRVRGRPPLPLQEGQRAPDQGAGDRDDRDRHGRRLDRPGRRAPPAPRRAGERGGAARPGRLRPRAARSRP